MAALRAAGIPARYASGYLHPHADASIGETHHGEGHAWLEAWIGDWHPVDPTSGAPVAERQISCVLERLKLTGCRFDHPAIAAGAPSGASRILQILESLDMEAPDGVATDGQVFYPPAMITVTREQLL